MRGAGECDPRPTLSAAHDRMFPLRRHCLPSFDHSVPCHPSGPSHTRRHLLVRPKPMNTIFRSEVELGRSMAEIG